ncbi:MAG: ABC transporter permease [Eubacterium sp.]|nr:ABC transporter permease [Eubacterium sp.]
MNPLSPVYYIRNNKGRAALIIFMLFFTTLMFLAGNYIASIDWYWEENIKHNEKMALVEALPGDEDFSQYHEVVGEMEKDPNLHLLGRTGLGFPGLDWITTIGLEMGSSSMVFSSKEDMETAFRALGLTADLSDMKHYGMAISKALAKNKGLHLGDIADATVDSSLDTSYTVDALIEEDTYTVFYLIECDPENYSRMYVFSDSMEGDALYNYIYDLIGDREVKVGSRSKIQVGQSLMPLHIILLVGGFLLSVILAVTVNSVVNGQYIKRTYEFGVYRALGLSKKTVFRKCAAELLLMDLIAIVIGAAIHFLLTFLLNELMYIPKGRYLPYVSVLGLICFLVSNLTVMLPMLISKGRRMGRADVTEF